MKNMSDKQLQLHIRAVILLILSMTAIAMVGQVARQNWNSKVTAYPTKTEAAIHDYAQHLLSKMTTEEKVAQMFFAMHTSDSELAAELGLGGVLLSAQNIEGLSSAEVQAVISSFQSASETPMFIGVNEEGGAVNTLSQYPQLRGVPFLSPAELMTTGGMNLVETDAHDKCDFLQSLGVNVNLAPVCDVATVDTAYMFGRALGRDADDTARYTEAVVKVMNDEGMIGALKHFPGYGNQTEAVGTDNRPITDFETADFLPFRKGIKAGAKMVMMSHSVVTAIDPNRPASLSREVHQILRRSFGFDGVIITDDLVMQAITDVYGAGEAAVLAVLAGNDLLCSSEYAIQYEAVLAAVQSGRISEAILNNAVRNVLEWKAELGLID